MQRLFLMGMLTLVSGCATKVPGLDYAGVSRSLNEAAVRTAEVRELENIQFPRFHEELLREQMRKLALRDREELARFKRELDWYLEHLDRVKKVHRDVLNSDPFKGLVPPKSESR